MKNALSPLRKFGERIFGGGGVNTLLNATERPSTAFSDHRESKTAPGAYMPLNAPTGGNKGIYKKLISGALAAVMLLALAGCGGGHGSNDLTDKQATEDAIEAYITERVTKECGYILDEGEPISVLIVNGQASVTIRTFADFCIPAAAEELLPVVLEALEENDTDLGKVSFTYYRTNNSGVVDGSMVDWTTRDGEKGTFASEPDDTTHTGYTIEDLQDYYKDFEELVDKLRSGEQ